MQTQRIIETASELIRTNLETLKCSGEDVVVFFFCVTKAGHSIPLQDWPRKDPIECFRR